MLAFVHSLNPLYSLSGLVVGALGADSPASGGGALMTPLLVLLFGIHPATAVGTDLLYAGLTKISGSVVHGLNGAIDWRITRRLASGSVPAAALTLILLGHFGKDTKSVSEVITSVLGFALILTAITLVFRALAAAQSRRNAGSPRRPTDRCADRAARRRARRAGLDLVGRRRRHRRHGAADALSQTPTVRIVGSDIAHAVPLTLIAGAGHWWIGSVDWTLLASLLIGSIPGIAIGSSLASRVPIRCCARCSRARWR